MIKEPDILTATEKEVIKYADLILAFFKNNKGQGESWLSYSQKLTLQMQRIILIVNNRAKSRLWEQYFLKDKTMTGAEKKSLAKKIAAGRRLDKSIAQQADALQILYLRLLNMNNRAVA